MSFNWQTDEEREDLWREAEPDAAERPPSRRGRWLGLLLLLAVLSASVYLVWQETQQQVEEAEANIEADVLSSHQLGVQAAQEGDAELFITILSGREQQWTDAQKELLEEGLLYEQRVRPLGLTPDASAPEVVDITFSPDLRDAELTVEQRYRPANSDDEAGSLRLQQTYVYRKGTQRWLFAPPTDEFWGSQARTQGQILRLRYPTRDEALALRLANDLDALLQELCTELAACPADMQVRVGLETDPATVMELNDARGVLEEGLEMSLPAPSLLATPVDDAGYQALLHGYGRHVAAAALSADYDCCAHVLFQQAFLARQLAALGLVEEPLAPADILYLADRPLTLDPQIEALWRVSEPVNELAAVPLELHAFLQFLLSEEGGPGSTTERVLQQALDDRRGFWVWMENHTEYSSTRSLEVSEAWQRYVRDLLEEAQAALPLPSGLTLPLQDMLLACGDEILGVDLYRYNPQSEQWTEEAELDAAFALLSTLPSSQGYFVTLQERWTEEEPPVLNLLRRPGEELLQVAGSGVSPGFFLPFSSERGPGDSIAAWRFNAEGGVGMEGHVILHPSSCDEGGCGFEELPGRPVWGPLGQQLSDTGYFTFVDVQEEGSPIYYRAGEQDEWVPVAQGISPVWLDEATFAYLAASDPRNRTFQAVQIQGLAAEEPVTVLQLDDLEQLPAGSGRWTTFVSLWRNESDPGQLLAVGAGGQDGQAGWLIGFSRTDPALPWGEARVSLDFLVELPGSPASFGPIQSNFSPDGRWLALLRWREDEGSSWWLYDLSKQEVGPLLFQEQEIVPFDSGQSWTADSQWFAHPGPGFIDLIAPGHDVDGRPYRRLIFHDFDACTSITWLSE